MAYEGIMDEECVQLCDAVNKLSGIETIASCCGHGKHSFCVWFVVKHLKYLPRLLYYLDVCHCGFSGWQTTVTTDCAMSPVHFCIRGPVGAYDQAVRIAELIEQEAE